MLVRVPVLCALAASIAAAQTERPALNEVLHGRVVDVSAGEFFFKAPDSIPAGLTTFRLRQVGYVLTQPEKMEADNLAPATSTNDPTGGFHMLWLTRLEQGKTATDFYNAQARGEPTPWAIDMGGPSFTRPPRTSNATFLLEPGNYVLVCHVGSAREDKNRRHLLKGMLRPLTVLPSSGVSKPLPAPDVIVRMTGAGQLSLSGPVARGRQVIRVVNETAKPHEFIVQRIKPGRSAQEAVTWRRTDGTSNPNIPSGGLSDVPPGTTSTTTVVFENGTYVFWTTRSPGRSVEFTVASKD